MIAGIPLIRIVEGVRIDIPVTVVVPVRVQHDEQFLYDRPSTPPPLEILSGLYRIWNLKFLSVSHQLVIF